MTHKGGQRTEDSLVPSTWRLASTATAMITPIRAMVPGLHTTCMSAYDWSLVLSDSNASLVQHIYMLSSSLT